MGRESKAGRRQEGSRHLTDDGGDPAWFFLGRWHKGWRAVRFSLWPRTAASSEIRAGEEEGEADLGDLSGVTDVSEVSGKLGCRQSWRTVA